jgi:hypothetical protein
VPVVGFFFKRCIVNVVNTILSFIGNLASIVGLFMTVLVWFGVRSLRSFYVAKATIPLQIEELLSLREKIEQLLIGKFDTANKNTVLELGTEANLNIQNLQPKLRRMDKAQYTNQIQPNALSFTDAYEAFVRSPTKENARIMNRRLFEFLGSSELLIKDSEWRRIQ